jgi:hypothetical protein
LEAIVDEVDLPLVAGHKWYAQRGGGGHLYAARRAARGDGHHLVYMHRVLAGAKPGQDVDHANRDALDNRRSNLRLATRSQNLANKRLLLRNTSGFKGVCFARSGPSSRPWVARLGVAGREIWLGYFDEPAKAARAYDEAAEEHFGKFARTNASMGLL